MEELRLDDDSARHSAALRHRLKEPLATVLTQYFNEEKIQPDWSAVTLAQIQVLVDTLNIANISKWHALLMVETLIANPDLPFNSELEVAGLEVASKKGSLSAMLELADYYLQGIRVEKDVIKAINYLEQSAEKKSAAALNKLAQIYTYGLGVPINYDKAFRYYKLSAELGDKYGQYGLAFALKNGWGTEKNPSAEIFWTILSAEQGFDQAQHDMGWNYHMNDDFGIDYKLALFWYKLAAAQGFMDSINNIGELYLNGNGVDKDLVEAYQWFSIAAMNGDKDAATSVSDIENEITEDEKKIALTAKSNWLNLHPLADKKIIESISTKLRR